MTVEVAPGAPRPSPVAGHIRGSTLLLVGRVAAQALELGAQILLVRYLSMEDYGAFSYALAAALLFKSVAMFGLPDTLARYIPLYRERGRYDALLGSLRLGFGAVLGLGLLLAAGVVVGVHWLGVRPIDDQRALTLLAILALLIPLEAVDGLLTALYATLGDARTIFLRQALVPALRFALVVGMIALGADVVFLTLGYLAISLVGAAIYGGLFGRLVRGQARDWPAAPRRRAYPVREIFTFAVPMLTTALIWILMESSDVLLLGHFRDADAVATFRAVAPVARLNQGVIVNFAILFTPLASRLYARGDRDGLGALYGQTALWVTVLTFPIFALTGALAGPLTVGLFGARYADATPLMALLSLGYFFQTALGFNGLTLKVCKKLRYSVAIDSTAAVLNIAINLALIPSYGARGAAVGTATTLVVHNLLKQYGLWRYTGITLFHRRYLAAYGAVAAVALALVGVEALWHLTFWLALPVGAAASLLVLWGSRGALDVAAIFPEIDRWPLVRLVLQPLLRAP
ncbi:MAG TPA: flippase [Thermomicrobiales bacterium]|nr:flippase [Thermomicrobiales bacterium]